MSARRAAVVSCGVVSESSGGQEGAPIHAGDVIAWPVRGGLTYSRVEWLRDDGTCGLMARDGFSEFHERLPRGAHVVPAGSVAFAAARPVAYE